MREEEIEAHLQYLQKMLQFNNIFPFDWFLVLFYLPFYIYAEFLIIKGKFKNPFSNKEKNIFQFIHHPLPSIIIPLSLCIILVKFNYWYLFVIAAILINMRIYKLSVIKNNFIVLFFIRGLSAIKQVFRNWF